MPVSDELFTRRRVGASISANASYLSQFLLTEDPISESSRWTNGLAVGLDWTNVRSGLGADSTTHMAFGNRGTGNPPPYDDSIACLSGFQGDQYAQATIYKDGAAAGQMETELLLRFHIVAHGAYGYEIDCTPSGIVVVRWNGPLSDFTALTGAISTNYTFSNGNVIYAQIIGPIITVKCNGLTVQTYDTSSDTAPTLNAPYTSGQGLARYTDGSPGIGFYRDSTLGAPGANNTVGWTVFSASGI